MRLHRGWLRLRLRIRGLLLRHRILLLCFPSLSVSLAAVGDLSRRGVGTARLLGREYEPEVFWWELVEMARRFVLVGLAVRYQGTMMQLVVGKGVYAAKAVRDVDAEKTKGPNRTKMLGVLAAVDWAAERAAAAAAAPAGGGAGPLALRWRGR